MKELRIYLTIGIIGIGLISIPQEALTQATGTLRTMSFKGLLSGAVVRDAHSKANDLISVKDFGAKGDGTTDDKNAFIAAIAVSTLSQCIFIPDAVYAVSDKITADHAICLTGNQWRLKYTGGGTVAYVLGLIGQATVYAPNATCGAHGGSCYGDHTSFYEGSFIQGAILDGQGNATDGLALQGVVSGDIRNVRATNVTDAGFKCNWCQQITFEHPMVSRNFEAFTTTPARCIVIDSISSANTINEPNCEHTSTQGIDLVYAINTTIKGGTSEGIGTSGANKFGLKMWGNNPAPNPNDDGTDFHYNINNSILNLDLEENHFGGDISCGENCYFNTFYGTNSFSIPGITLRLTAHDNSFFGGTMGSGSTGGAQTTSNRIVNMSTIDITGTTVWVDSGNNHVDPIYNQFNNNVINPRNQNNQSQMIMFGATGRPIELYNNNIGSFADVVIGKSTDYWLGMYSQDGGQSPFLHYNEASPGMCFLGEPTLRSNSATIDGCIIAHKWGIGGTFSSSNPPITTLHVKGATSTTFRIDTSVGQGGSFLAEFRDDSGNQFGGIDHIGVYQGAVSTFGAHVSVTVTSGTCTTGTPTGGATAGTIPITHAGTGCTFLVTMGTTAGIQVTASTGWSCWAAGSSVLGLGGILRGVPFNTIKAIITGDVNNADVINFGCMGY